MLARTYIQSAQGTIQKMKFNTETGGFTATFQLDSMISAPTVIHVLNESVHGEPVWYPEGAKLFLSHDGDQPIDKSLVTIFDKDDTNRISFKLDSSLHNKLIEIVIQ